MTAHEKFTQLGYKLDIIENIVRWTRTTRNYIYEVIFYTNKSHVELKKTSLDNLFFNNFIVSAELLEAINLQRGELLK